MKTTTKQAIDESALYSFTGEAPLQKAVPLALQHVVAMVVGCITMPMLVAGVAGVSNSNQIIMVQASLFCASVAIFLQVFHFKGVGSGLPVIIGSGFAFLPTLVAIVSDYGMAGMLGAQVVGALLGVLVGVFFKYISFLFPPLVTASVVITIGISLYPTAVNYMAGGNAKSATYGSVHNWIIAAITLITVIICNQFCKGILKASSTLAGMVVGYFTALLMGDITFDSIGTAGWFQLPQPLHFGIEFHPSAIIMLGIVFIVNAVQDIGQFEATANGAYNRGATDKELSGGVIANNLASMLGGFLGGTPTATCGQNVGIVVTTKVINRTVFALAGAIVALAAFMPKLAAVLITIPQPVLGGATLSVFASIAMTGIRMLSKEGLSPRSVFIAGLSIAFATGVVQTKGAFALFPTWFSSIFGSSQVILVALMSIILNLIIPNGEKEKQ